jgi:hypothetical protein
MAGKDVVIHMLKTALTPARIASFKLQGQSLDAYLLQMGVTSEAARSRLMGQAKEYGAGGDDSPVGGVPATDALPAAFEGTKMCNTTVL